MSTEFVLITLVAWAAVAAAAILPGFLLSRVARDWHEAHA